MAQNKKLYILLGVFLLVLVYQFVYVPNTKNIDSMKKLLLQKNADNSKLLTILSDYSKKQNNNISFQYPPENFSLFEFVSTIIEKNFSPNEIKKITSVTETKNKTITEDTMSVDIEDVPLEKILFLIHTIEDKPFVFFSKYQLTQEKSKPYLVTASIELAIYKK